MDPRKELADATHALEAARRKRDRAIVRAAKRGMSQRAIASAAGLSQQRVGQIIREAAER